MKKTLSLLLALLMVATALPLFVLGSSAEGGSAAAPTTTTTYAVYRQDFETLGLSDDKSSILQALGWYVPTSRNGVDPADLSIVEVGEGNHALRVNTIAPVGLESDSLITVYGGDTMGVLRTGRFTLSYQLTYRAGSTNTDGYSSMIYNYNGQDGATMSGDGPATYGIVAVRVCGTGFNGVYYPVTSGSTMSLVEDVPNASELSLGNRHSTTGAYPSLYARLFLEDPSEEAADATLAGNSLLVDKTLNVRIEYSFLGGVYVYINDVLVSKPSETSNGRYANITTWNDFVTRTSGTDIALLTKSGVVADIDNISIETDSLGLDESDRKMPELVVTEVAPTGIGYDGNYWSEYIEIYNPTDQMVDLSKYSLIFTDTMYDGDAKDSISNSRMNNYTNYITLDSLFGKALTSTTNYYGTAEYLRQIGTSRYIFSDSGTTLESGTRYRKDGSSYVVDSNGDLIKFKYVETWNERYDKANNYTENGQVYTSRYAKNTMLAPGACLLIYTILQSDENCWKYGVNAGKNGTLQISSEMSFRNVYKTRGLSTDSSIKVIAECSFNLADSECRRYYIGYAQDEEGNEINYRKLLSTDLTHIVSYADYCSPLVSGKLNGGTDPSDLSTLGNAAIQEGGFSACFVYGVDASTDYRAGTMYVDQNRVRNSNHVGLVAGYQKILFDAMKKTARPALSITEIAPRTLNLKGEEKSAFSAMEVTNTSGASVNLYSYAIVRNELGTACGYGQGFTRAVQLRAGNPVNKGLSNGAYYYFMDEHISNPSSCTLAPGESAVIWFVNEETYSSYMGDDDFGVDYFRQYWVNMGNSQLAEKDANGEYITKVIVADGNSGTTYNKDNANKVLDLSYISSAVYGIAVANENVLANQITSDDVISVAYLGQISTYYNLYETEAEISGVTYVFQKLDYKNIPANGSMHYIPCRAGAGACSGMARSLKVQYWNFNNSLPNYYEKSKREPGQQFRISLRTNYAMQTPDLGTVRGEEALAIGDTLFYALTDAEGNKTYYYYDSLRTSVKTLQGAALNTVGDTAYLRFDNAVPATVYQTLAATYGAENLTVGMLIVETSRVSSLTKFTKEMLDRSSIPYVDAVGSVVFRTNDYVVLGSTVEVSSGNYGTSYTAIGYLRVKLANGTTKTIWSNNLTTGSVRNVAKQAVADIQKTQDATYQYKLTSGSGYSRYTQAEQTVLRRFAGL